MKTLKDLKDCLSIDRMAPCNYKVKVNYRNKAYVCRSNNSLAWDRLSENDDIMDYKKGAGGLTLKQAYQQFYDECLRSNGIL